MIIADKSGQCYDPSQIWKSCLDRRTKTIKFELMSFYHTYFLKSLRNLQDISYVASLLVLWYCKHWRLLYWCRGFFQHVCMWLSRLTAICVSSEWERNRALSFFHRSKHCWHIDNKTESVQIQFNFSIYLSNLLLCPVGYVCHNICRDLPVQTQANLQHL